MRFISILFCAVCVLGGSAEAQDKPSVILIMTDDQGYGDPSCHGNPILKTSHLDQLHAESIRLTDFHVSPFCTPTRAASMSGRYLPTGQTELKTYLYDATARAGGAYFTEVEAL